MKIRLMFIGLFCLVFFFAYGQENISLSSQQQEKSFPFKGGIEAFRQFFNENLNLDMVANPDLPKGKMSVICVIDSLGRADIVSEPAQYYDENKEKLSSYDKKNIGNEFVRVARLVKWENPANLKEIRCMIIVSIPYKADNQECMRVNIW